MHIPDNYLSPATCLGMGAAMVPVWSVALRKVRAELPRSRMPMLGIGAAFAFLIMMFNLPVPGGTTAHAVGGVLLAALLGPWAACLAVSVALVIQALLFGDGGVLALGANSFNMAFVLPFLGYFIFKFLKDRLAGERGALVSLAVAAYLALNLAALCAAIELGFQPVIARDAAGLPLYAPYPLAATIPAMVIPHLFAGFLEAGFTVGVYSFIRRVSPGSLYQGAKTRISAVLGLLVGLACLAPLGLLAPGQAWGEGMAGFGPAWAFHGHPVLGGYGVPGLPEWAGYVLSGFAGMAVLIIIFKLFGLLRARTS